jgi:hypothetical protein
MVEEMVVLLMDRVVQVEQIPAVVVVAVAPVAQQVGAVQVVPAL